MKASRTRFGLVWLTLVAFSVQLAVAVLHHHDHSIDRGWGFAARAMTAGLCAPSSKHPCKPGPHENNDGCVLCWAAAMAANSLEPPPLPQIPLPQMAVGVRIDASETQAVTLLHRGHFRARGPPRIQAT
jgi:hypothetical protein